MTYSPTICFEAVATREGKDLTRKRFHRIEAALCGLAALMFSSAAPAADTVTLFMGTTPDYANIYVARDKGFFEQEGIKVDIRLFPSGSAATDGFRSGKVEFVASGDAPALRLCQVTGAFVIAPTSYDGFSPVFMVRADIKSPADLKGKRFGTRVGSSAELFIDLVKKKYNLPDDAFKLINLEPTDMVAALDRGDIDGFLWFSPFEERSMTVSGNKVRLFLRGGEVGYTNEVTLVARGDLTAEKPELVTRFLKALIKGSDYATDHRDETVNIVAAALKLDKKAAEVTREMNFPVAFDKRLYERYGVQADFMLSHKMIKDPIDLKSCFWTKGIAAADPKRVTQP
jgi:ABC-type nitrate/sulfonate/bicarbonate transport system substrate-binding protein